MNSKYLKPLKPLIAPMHYIGSYMVGHFFNECEFRGLEKAEETGELVARMRLFGANGNLGPKDEQGNPIKVGGKIDSSGFVALFTVAELEEKKKDLSPVSPRPHVRRSLGQIEKALKAIHDPKVDYVDKTSPVPPGLRDKQSIVPKFSDVAGYLATSRVSYLGHGFMKGVFGGKKEVVISDAGKACAAFRVVSPIFPLPQKTILDAKAIDFSIRRISENAVAKAAASDDPEISKSLRSARLQYRLGQRAIRLYEAKQAQSGPQPS